MAGEGPLRRGALIALADIATLRGDLARATLLLASAVEVDAWNAGAHERMAGLYRAIAAEALACAHVHAAAQVDRDDRDRQVADVRCGADRERSLAGLSKRQRSKAVKALKKPARARGVAGSLVVTADWSTVSPLDVAIVTPQGRVISRLGGEKKLRLSDARSTLGERLGTPLWELGRYQVLVVHGELTDEPARPVSGKLKIKVYGVTKTLSFTTDGRVARVADVRTEKAWR